MNENVSLGIENHEHAKTRTARSFYRPELDALRFVAFLLVFYTHTAPREASGYALPYAIARFLPYLSNAASLGLCLFFSLSAYLICELLLREKTRIGTVRIGRFYIRRMLRIWPLYFLGVAIGMAWAIHYGGFRKDIPLFVAYGLMSANVYIILHSFGGVMGGPAFPLWSISIEEQFYLFWPGLAKFCSEKSLHYVAWAIILIANLTLVYLGLRHTDIDIVWTNSLVQFYMFGAGVLLSLSLHGRMPNLSSTNRILLATAGFASWLIASFAFNIRTQYQQGTVPGLVFGYALIAIGCIALMVSFMGINSVPQWLAYLGRRSYGLYVFHMLAIDVCGGIIAKLHWQKNLLLLSVAAFLGDVVLAALSYRYFEAPFLRLKDKEAVIHTLPPPSLAN